MMVLEKYGIGVWRRVLKDSEFRHLLKDKTTIDLSNRWRSFMLANGTPVPKSYKRNLNQSDLVQQSLSAIERIIDVDKIEDKHRHNYDPNKLINKNVIKKK